MIHCRQRKVNSGNSGRRKSNYWKKLLSIDASIQVDLARLSIHRYTISQMRLVKHMAKHHTFDLSTQLETYPSSW